MAQDYDGLRSFIRDCQELGEFLEIDDADWNLEIGALTETAAEHLDDPPTMLFEPFSMAIPCRLLPRSTFPDPSVPT